MKPGDYKLGSPASRAAARSLLAQKLVGQKRIDIVLTSSIPRPPGKEMRINVGKWEQGPDGTLTRFSIIPMGMKIEEAERISVSALRTRGD